MSSKSKVPDAWDDDWTHKADQRQSPSTSNLFNDEVKLSKAEKRARQAELNKRLWDEAETPNNPYFVESQNSVPLKSDFKPAVKVLSRKPAPTVVARKDPISGLEQLTMEDDEDDDDDGFEQLSMTLEERRIKAQKEREEKQKKYEEVREKLFGSSEKVTSTSVADATAVPVVKFSGERNRPKSRGGRDTRPSTTNNIARQLYDPNYSPKPDSNYAQSKEGQTLGLDDEKVIRNPRGPDGSGRGGFGVSNRGGKTL